MTKLAVIDKNTGIDLIAINWKNQEIFGGLTTGSISATEEALSKKVAMKGGDIFEDGSRLIYANSNLLEGFKIANNIFEELGLERAFPEFSELITIMHVGPPKILDADAIKIRRFGEILSEEVLIRKIMGDFSGLEVAFQESVIDVIKKSINRWLTEGNVCWYERNQINIDFEKALTDKIPSSIKKVYFTKFPRIDPLTFFNKYKAEKAQKEIIEAIKHDIDLYINNSRELKKIRDEKEKIINNELLKTINSITFLKNELNNYHNNLEITLNCLNAEFAGKTRKFEQSFDLREINMIESIKQLNVEDYKFLNQPDFKTTGLNQESLAKYNIELSNTLDDLNLNQIRSKLDKIKDELVRNHQDTSEIDNLICAISEIYVLNQSRRHFEKRFGELVNEIKEIPTKYKNILKNNEKIREISKNLENNYIQNAINLIFNNFGDNLEIFMVNPNFFNKIEEEIISGFNKFSDLFFKEIGPVSILQDIIQKLEKKIDSKNIKQRKLFDLLTSFLNNYLNRPIEGELIKIFFELIKKANQDTNFITELKQLKIDNEELTSGNQALFIEVIETTLTQKNLKKIPKSTPEGISTTREDFTDSLLQTYLEIYHDIFGNVTIENKNILFKSGELLKIFLGELIFHINILKYFYVLKAFISEIENPQLKTVNFLKVLPKMFQYFKCTSLIDCLIKGKELDEIFKIMKREVFKVIGESENYIVNSFSIISEEFRKRNKKFQLDPIENLEFIPEYEEIYNLNAKLVSIVKEQEFSVKSLYAFNEGKGDDLFKENNLKRNRIKFEKVQKNIRKNADKEFDILEKNVTNLIQKQYVKYLPKKYPDEKDIAEISNKLMKKNKKLFDYDYFSFYNQIFIKSLIYTDRYLLLNSIDQDIKSQKVVYNEKIDEIKNNIKQLIELTNDIIFETISNESLIPFLISKIDYQNDIPFYSFPLKLNTSLIEKLSEEEIDNIFGKNIVKGAEKAEIYGILFKSIKLEEKESNFGCLIFSHSYKIIYEKYNEILSELADIGKDFNSKFEKDFYYVLFNDTFLKIKEKISKLSE